MEINSCDQPSIDVDQARRMFEMADSEGTFDSWLAERTRMAFYQSPHDDLFVRQFQAERPWPKIFTDFGRLAGTLVATYWDTNWPQEHPQEDEYDVDTDDEPKWRPAKVAISGIEGTFDGEICSDYDYMMSWGTHEAVRFTAEVTGMIALAFEGQSDHQLNSVDEEDAGSERWNSDKYGRFLPRAYFSPGEFSVVVGDDDWDSVYPDKDGMYVLDFDGFGWVEAEPPKPNG